MPEDHRKRLPNVSVSKARPSSDQFSCYLPPPFSVNERTKSARTIWEVLCNAVLRSACQQRAPGGILPLADVLRVRSKRCRCFLSEHMGMCCFRVLCAGGVGGKPMRNHNLPGSLYEHKPRRALAFCSNVRHVLLCSYIVLGQISKFGSPKSPSCKFSYWKGPKN